MPFYQRGDVRIRYEEVGSGFPLLVIPGRGLNSRISNWQNAVINAMEEFKHDFRCITMDQRNATSISRSSDGLTLSEVPDAAQAGILVELGSKPIKSYTAASASGQIPDIGDVERSVREGPIGAGLST